MRLNAYTLKLREYINSIGMLISIFICLSFTTQIDEPIPNIKIAAGYEHSLVLHNGQVWSWGNNKFGQLGNGSKVDWAIPMQVFGLKNIIDIAPGSSSNHGLALKANGTVWTWGNNKSGQLGIGNDINYTIPKQIKQLHRIKSIAAGNSHSLAVDDNGSVWVWGTNYNGIGHRIKISSNTPLRVESLNNIESISVGHFHSLALSEHGEVWAWGKNSTGQLGIGRIKEAKMPIHIDGLHDIVQISAGNSHSVAVKADGTVWTWGWNDYGQLGTNNMKESFTPVKLEITDVIAVSAGAVHTLALKKDGTVWAWGSNIFGQVGRNSSKNYIRPTKVSTLKNIISITAGDLHSIALDKEGTIYSWGANSKGQLGNGIVKNSFAPVPVFKPSNDQTATQQIMAFAGSSSNTKSAYSAQQHTARNKGTALEQEKTVKEQKKTPANYYKITLDEAPLIDTAVQFHEISADEFKNDEACPITKELQGIDLTLKWNNAEKQVNLTWFVDTNAESIDFTLERKLANGDWKTIEPIQFMSQNEEQFVFETNDIIKDYTPKVSYRLKQMDCHGNFSFSAPQFIDFN